MYNRFMFGGGDSTESLRQELLDKAYAGDVYDKTVPSAEAVALLDDFLVKLADRSLAVLLISGNHDSPERLAFSNRLMEQRGVYIAPVYPGREGSMWVQGEGNLLKKNELS